MVVGMSRCRMAVVVDDDDAAAVVGCRGRRCGLVEGIVVLRCRLLGCGDECGLRLRSYGHG